MKKILYLFFVLLCSIIAIFVCHKQRNQPATTVESIATTTNANVPKKVVWLNVFVHGTFGTMLGILSLNNVLKDEVGGTTYRDANRGMRDDAYFFQTQPILARGLLPVTPDFNIASTGKKILAVYPITKAFDEFLKTTPLSNEEQRYYAFGWSGLISQHCRRFESIRLYNALQEEITQLKKQNIEPKIRIMAHSHGGNLCLNLGAITPILNTKTFNEFHKFSLNKQTNDSIKKMLTIIKTLPTKEQVAQETGQKRLDYVPVEKKLSIDELILLGTPIQQETEHFMSSSIFKTIYNVYSEQDSVQQLDWISTKNKASKQRADDMPSNPTTPRIVQIKIMYERPIVALPDRSLRVVKTDNTQNISVFDKLLGTRPISKDPGHKELWSLAWARAEYSNNSQQSFLSPLPTLVMIPLIVTTLAKNPTLTDVDLNLTPTNKAIGLFVTTHQEDIVRDSCMIEASLLDRIKTQIASWETLDASARQDFKMMYQHLTNLKQSSEKQHQKDA